MEAVELHDAAGGQDHRRRRHGEGIHMEERQRRNEPLFTVSQGAKAAFVDVAVAYIQEIEVAEQASIRLSRRPRRVEQGTFVRIAAKGRGRRIEALEHLIVGYQASVAVL